MTLLERIQTLREENGNMSVNKLEKEAGLSRGSMAKWDDHAPSHDKLQKVADYFSVSVDYLLGNTDIKKDPTVSGEADEITKELYSIWSTASEEERAMLLDMARVIKSRRKKD